MKCERCETEIKICDYCDSELDKTTYLCNEEEHYCSEQCAYESNNIVIVNPSQKK